MRDPVAPDAAPSAIPSAVNVRREIWKSLVSMLRVYAHAAEVNHGVFAVNEIAGGVVLASREGVVAISLNPETGAGHWELRGSNGACGDGRFSILADGKLVFDEEEKQLDSAAIDWVEALTRLGADSRLHKS